MHCVWELGLKDFLVLFTHYNDSLANIFMWSNKYQNLFLNRVVSTFVPGRYGKYIKQFVLAENCDEIECSAYP